jgi:hypothetical protein
MRFLLPLLTHLPTDISDLVAKPLLAVIPFHCDMLFQGYRGARSKQAGIVWPFELPPLSGGEKGLT